VTDPGEGSAAATEAATDIPLLSRLTRDLVVHDLAADGAEVLRGVFMPLRSRVVVEVQSAYSFLGNSRGALLFYAAQPDTPGALLYDSGGAPVPGAAVHSVASVNGESAWATTCSRRLILDVEPGRPVTWQIIAGIIGGSQTLPVPGAERIAVTPDGRTAFVTCPAAGVVTPIALGRPGYSYDRQLNGMDELRPAIACADATHVCTGDLHALVSQGGARPRLSILAVADRTIVAELEVTQGAPLGGAVAPDGSFAVVATDAGALLRVALPGGECATATVGGRLVDAAIGAGGDAAWVADSARRAVHRLRLPGLTVQASAAVPAPPCAVRVAQDGGVWVLCRPDPPAPGRLLGIDPAGDRVLHDFELPFAAPRDMALIPVAEQTSGLVRTAWVVFDGGRYCEFNIAGTFAGQVHSMHRGGFGEDVGAGGVAVNDFGEIWVAQPAAGDVFKWIGGRLQCRADEGRMLNGIFFGEYCEVLVHGAAPVD